MKELLGQIVTKVELSADKQYLNFTLQNGETLLYFADGDCCSNSWFEHFVGIHQLLNANITDIEEIDMSDLRIDDDEQYECLQFYGIKLRTKKGFVAVEFRNSSNGYYGGSLELMNKENSDEDYTYFSNQVNDKQIVELNFKEITEDF